ncbi:MAG: spondin domain-containing protein [Rhodobacteraceae bacterium]|nr:spondin domain-containing protein [Paracoccaceae bacterium]
MSMLRITVTNNSPDGGTFLTPFWFGLHNGAFDLGDIGDAASPGLEALAEDGSFDAIAAELTGADAGALGGAVFGAAGPIATGEVATALLNVDGISLPYISLAAMILPSNDAFIGTLDAVELFAEDGDFIGPVTLTFDGSDVYDAGTEVNTELDAAFINQMGPNTGETENGVITLHPGFNGSEGNPDGEGDQIILGGTNAFGVPIDPTAADFTREGAQIAQISIEEVAVRLGSSADETFEVSDFASAARIAGDGGTDVVDASGTSFDAVEINRIDGGFAIATEGGSALHISGIEEIRFDDATLSVQSGGAVQTVGLFYETLLGRDSDIAGLSFWSALGAGDFGLGNVADFILASDEFVTSNGTLAGTDDFLDFIYQSALGREADAEGRAFWEDALDSGAVDRGEVALGFATAVETLDRFADTIDDGFILFG